MTLPDPARYARDAAKTIGATFEDLDEGGGYLFRVSLNGRSVLAGAGPIASFPVNSAVSFTLSRDKAFTKAVLAGAGLPVIPGGLFFAHERRIALRGPGREIADGHVFARKLGWPVFAKPNTGARGNFAEILADEAALSDYARRVALEFEAFLIEPVICGAEHRVLVQDGGVIFHSMKDAPTLLGDGRRTLGELLEALNRSLAGTGISPYPASVIVQASQREKTILAAGERIALPGRRNLSAVGGIEHFSPEAPNALADIASKAVAALGLRIGAVDLFDRSAKRDLSDLVVIEVNGNPGLKTLETAGRPDLICAIWTSMLTELLGAP